MKVAGLEEQRDSALTSKRVVSTRLSVMSCFRTSVQGASAIGAPARLMNASASSRTCSQGPVSCPFHETGFAFIPGQWKSCPAFLVRMLTLWPPWNNAAHNARPTNPVPPDTTMFIGLFPEPAARLVNQAESPYRAQRNSLIVLLDRPTNAPDRIRVYFDEAQYITKECVHVSRIRWLVRFRDHRPIGCGLDVQEWVTRRNIRNRGVHCWSHETTHFGRRRKTPAFLTAGRSDNTG